MKPQHDKKHDDHHDEPETDLVRVLDRNNKVFTALLEWLRSHFESATKQDLTNTEEKIVMKLSEVKTIIAQSAGQTKEALGELGTKIADLQKQIDDLIAGNGDPEVTDEQFLTDLTQLKTDTAALAAIVPNPTA